MSIFLFFNTLLPLFLFLLHLLAFLHVLHSFYLIFPENIKFKANFLALKFNKRPVFTPKVVIISQIIIKLLLLMLSLSNWIEIITRFLEKIVTFSFLLTVPVLFPHISRSRIQKSSLLI